MLGRYYSHVPLAAACMLLVLAAIVWLIVHRLDGWDPPWQPGTLAPGLVRLAPGGPEVASPPLDRPVAPRPRPAPAVMARPPETTPPAPPQFVIESGPFGSPDVADQMEERLNRLGHATIRFRQQDTTRLFVVSLTGFAAREEALEAAQQAGRGSVMDGPDGPEVVVAQLRSLGEAVAAARPLRARGLDVRVTEALAPIVIYHLRYGRFERRADAQLLREELARDGIPGRVVSLVPPMVRAR
jgi:hypothetical protein